MNITTMVSVHDRLGSKQANNMLPEHLADAVRPWFADIKDQRITNAINALSQPALRESAADFLGLELIPAA